MTAVVNDRARIPLARGRFHAAVVAGSPGLRESLARVLTSLGAADVTTAGLLVEARTLGRGTPTSLAVVECQLPDGSGIAAVEVAAALLGSEKVSRRMACAAMADAGNEIGAAVPFRALLRVGPERRAVEK